MNERTCTKDNPFSKERHNTGDRWIHDAAHEIGEQEDGWPGGDIVKFKCDNCGITWKSELPQ